MTIQNRWYLERYMYRRVDINTLTSGSRTVSATNMYIQGVFLIGQKVPSNGKHHEFCRSLGFNSPLGAYETPG